MLFFSCRKNFVDDNEFASLCVSEDTETIQDALDYTRHTTDIITVHGYNSKAVNVWDAARANTQMFEDCGLVGEHGVFAWPGLGESPLEQIRFRKAIRHANNAGLILAKYLVDGRAFQQGNGSKYRPIMLCGHSLGARVILKAVQVSTVHIPLIVLLGAAVNDECFEAEFADVPACVGSILVFKSENDGVLERLYKYDQFSNALGYSGPKGNAPSNVHVFDVTTQVPDHNHYRRVPSLWGTVRPWYEKAVS